MSMQEKKPISPERRAQLQAAGRARAKQFTPEYQRQAGQARAKQLTPEHQRQAALALRERVGAEYYRTIGRLGGKRTMYLTLMRIAANWTFSPELVATSKVSARKRDELVAGMREHYRQEAERYVAPWGNRIILAFYSPSLDGKGFKKKRGVRTPSKSCRKAATALRAGNSPNNGTGKSRKRKTETEKA